MDRTLFALLLAAAAIPLSEQPAATAQPPRALRMDATGNPYPETATSFDCHRARSSVERLICRDVGLAMLDGNLGETFWRLLRHTGGAERAQLTQSQQAWLRQRDACRDRQCIETTYEQRSRALERRFDERQKSLRASVSVVGQCQATRIEEIGPRLQQVQGEPPDGTSVAFENGVSQVSYDPVPSIWASRVGDTARVCLVFIPTHCPAGDSRGRVYETTNLRTGARWKLPDSSHRCGGA